MSAQGARPLWLPSSNKNRGSFFLCLTGHCFLLNNLIYLLPNMSELELGRGKHRSFSSQGGVWLGCVNKWVHSGEVLNTAAGPGESTSLFRQGELCFLVTISKTTSKNCRSCMDFKWWWPCPPGLATAGRNSRGQENLFSWFTALHYWRALE